MKPARASDMIPPEILIQAYQTGWFPMGDEDTGEIRWYSPDPRGILPLDAFHVPRRLQRVVQQGRFEIRFDEAFEDVMRGCADRGETWITEPIIDVYVTLHRLGIAHSVEAWQDGALAGGLYGVSIGGAFFGESMFHRVTDASKVALAALVQRLRSRGFLLLDIQWTTPHLEQFGAAEISRGRYLRLLRDAVHADVSFD